MRQIFISYRRDDASAYAGRLYDKLTSHFGEGRIFMDIDSIPFGTDFTEVLKDKLLVSNTALVVIGKSWLLAKDENGNQRIHDPKDFVRLEVAEAIRQNMFIVPVLVGGANMPRPDELPQDIALLSRRQAIEITDRRFRADVEQLIRTLETLPEAAKSGKRLGENDTDIPDEVNEQVSVFNLKLKYDVELAAGVVTKQLPFVIGVLADLSGKRRTPLLRLGDPSRRFVGIDRNNFNDVMKGVRPHLILSIECGDADCKADSPLEIEFERLEDFTPAGIAGRVPLLREYLEVRAQLQTLHAVLNGKLQASLQSILESPDVLAIMRKGAQNPEVQVVELLGRIMSEGGLGKDEWERAQIAQSIRTFFSGLLDHEMVETGEIKSIIEGMLTRINSKLSLWLNAILHHPEFQKLEAAWRGVHYLVMRAEIGNHVKVRVLNITSDELHKDMEKAVDWDQSSFFKKVYEEEYGTFGGEPYGVILADYYFGRDPQDIYRLGMVSSVVASAFTPFIAAADPSMFGWLSLDEINHHEGGLSRIFQGNLYSGWKAFRESVDSRYVYLALPQILLRAPYKTVAENSESVEFEEVIGGSEHYLWGNPAFMVGVSLLEAFEFGWNGAQGKKFEHAVGFFSSEMVDEKCGYPYRVSMVEINEVRDRELHSLGFVTCRSEPGTNKLIFESMPSCASTKSQKVEMDKPTKAGELNLIGLLTRCRIQHYVQAVSREKARSFTSKKDAEHFVNSWLREYLEPGDARIEFTRGPGWPELYRPELLLTQDVRLRRKLDPKIGKRFSDRERR